MKLHIAEPASPQGRFATGGHEWHSHNLVHVHADMGEHHSHIVATDEPTLERLRALLQIVATGNVTSTAAAEAVALLELTATA